MEEEIKKCRKKRKLRRYFLRIVIILAIFLLVLFLSFYNRRAADVPLYSNNLFSSVYYAGKNADSADKIALIRVKGIILNSGAQWDEIANANSISDQLYDAENNPSVKAIILFIDSPGGEISAVEKVYHRIEEVRKHGIKVIALMDSVAASGGYYISAGCDRVIAGKLTITGSVGVIINSYKYYDLLGKIGVQDEVYKTGKFKDFLNPARPSTQQEQELVKNMLDESYDDFIQVVSRGRINSNGELTPEYIKKSAVGDGRIFSGQEALKLGLIDQLGYYDDAVDEAIKLSKMNKNNIQIISYEENIGFTDFIQRLLFEKFKLNVEIQGITRNAYIRPGNLYFLYPGYLK